MSPAPERYIFPNAAQLDAALHAEPSGETIEAHDKALREASQQGYTDGFQEGRAAAELAAKAIFQDAHRQGYAAGCDQGLAQAAEAAAALRQAFEQFREWRAELLNEAEAFCVELVLAIVARLVELNEDSVEFVTRTVRAAIDVFAPELPDAIFVNPANSALVASAFPQIKVCAKASIPPAGVRIEAGRLLVESNIQRAFEKIKSAVLEARDRRFGPNTMSKERSARRSRPEPMPIAEGADQ
jgi:flagellar biosynthesis/type III secretory pathway protein FliH